MKQLRFETHSSDETIKLGEKFAKFLKPGDIVCLFGDLGTGKTTFVKGLAKGLKANVHRVHSPTFVLMNIYEGKCPIYHFDLYRINAADLGDLGYEEFFYGRGVSVIEWSERLDQLMPHHHWHVLLRHGGADKRLIKFSVQGDSLKVRLKKAEEGLK